MDLTCALVVSAIPGLAQSVCDAVSGNLIQNCGFETGSFSQWTVTLASSGWDLLMRTGAGWAHSGTYGVEFGATGTQNDSLAQTLATTGGATYQISFWLALPRVPSTRRTTFMPIGTESV